MKNTKKRMHIRERRDAVIDLYSEGRTQQEISQKLKICQATVHNDITFEKERIRNKSQTYLEEQLPFEHEACRVGLNKILRYCWDSVSINSESASNGNYVAHKMVMSALDLAKDCYNMKLKLLGNGTFIKEVMEFVEQHKFNKEQEIADALELERHRQRRIF